MEYDELNYAIKKGKLGNGRTSPVKEKMSTKQINTCVGTRKGIISRGRRGRGQAGMITLAEQYSE